MHKDSDKFITKDISNRISKDSICVTNYSHLTIYLITLINSNLQIKLFFKIINILYHSVSIIQLINISIFIKILINHLSI